MPRGFVLLALPPITPTYRADQQRRRGQGPRRHHRHAPCFCRAVLHSEFLPQTHLNASGSLRRSSCLREGLQLHASRLPGILQRCAPRAHARVLTSCGALPFTQRSVALGVQSNGFKFLALHFALPFLFFIAPRSRAAERRAASRVSPAARRARGAAAIESFRSGIRRPAPLPRSSVLPARTAPPLREIPPATPAPRRELAPSVRAFPPKLLESSHPAKQFPRRSHPRFFAPKKLPAAIARDVSSRGFALSHKEILRAFRGSRRISSGRASKSIKRPARFLPLPTRFPSSAARSGTSPPGADGIEE